MFTFHFAPLALIEMLNYLKDEVKINPFCSFKSFKNTSELSFGQ